MTGELLLFQQYNFYRRQMGADALKASPQYLKTLARFDAWCKARGQRPELLLYCAFAVRQWIRIPQLRNVNDLCTEKLIARVSEVTNLELFHQRPRPQASKADDADYRPGDVNRDLVTYAEPFKKRYQETGQHQRCIDEMELWTYGYHPESKFCARCPGAYQAACIAKLKQVCSTFDVMALRAGRMTLREAEEAHARVTGRHPALRSVRP